MSRSRRLPRGRMHGRCAMLLWLLGVAAARPGSAQEPITLQGALAEARAANARLTLSSIEAEAATERVREARARLGPEVAIEGDLRYGPLHPYGVDVGEDRLLAVLRQPIYSGGELRALLEQAGSLARSAGARARMDEKDVDREVRLRFAELCAGEDEVAVRSDALSRLEAYRSLVASRAASGQGVTADRLRAGARLASERADLEAARRRVDEARAEMNDLMGRQPEAPLQVAPLPRPEAQASPPPPGEVPDVLAARANLAAAEQEMEVVRAGRRPRLGLVVDAGFLGGGLEPPPGSPPGWMGAQAGMSAALILSWPIFDTGVHRARLAQARLARDASLAALTLAERRARLGLARAEVSLARSRLELAERDSALPLAHDAYLQEQALYLGGLASSLEVLDAYTTWRDARIAQVQAVLAYRAADAERIRWSTP